ncbi:MAG: glutathione S-transferase [Myxococcales bacterium]|nr:glutathione S-transferase [Myxococcales bacterium]
MIGSRLPMARIELLQFPYSTFNEKARWALDWKRIPHARTNLLPGPHRARVARIAPASTTPVLLVDGAVVQGSAAIVAELERRYPEPPLYPADPAQRERALAIERRFDDEVGPAARQVVFRVLLDEGAYMCALFSEGHARAKRALYRGMFPVARRLIARAYRTRDDADVARGLATVERALDELATQPGPSGHLVGDAFSVADLAAASLLAPLAGPAHPDMAFPAPVPAALRAFTRRFEDHPGAKWIRETYARHRGPAREALR